MKGLRRIGTMNIAVVGLLCFYVAIVKVTGQSVITADLATYFSNIKIHKNHCECIKYNCGCCQYLEWNDIFVNGTLCANASYLEHEYGISVTVTFNKFTIINETVSARNPPPICVGENIVDLELELCLHIYDIDFESDKFHACFEIFGKIMKLRIAKLQLGCVNTNLYKKIKYIENTLIDQTHTVEFTPLMNREKQEKLVESTLTNRAIWIHDKIKWNLMLLSLYTSVLLKIFVMHAL